MYQMQLKQPILSRTQVYIYQSDGIYHRKNHIMQLSLLTAIWFMPHVLYTLFLVFFFFVVCPLPFVNRKSDIKASVIKNKAESPFWRKYSRVFVQKILVLLLSFDVKHRLSKRLVKRTICFSKQNLAQKYFHSAFRLIY